MKALTADPLALRLLAETRDGVALFDPNYTLLAWNAAARAITGWDEATAAKQDLLTKATGMIEIREGKWVDMRHTIVTTVAGDLRLVLFADTTTHMELREARRALTDGGLLDGVTQMAGAQIALAHLGRSVALARRDERAVGLLSIGCDVPSVAEAVESDELMRQLGKRVLAATRASDLAARFGDSELLIVLTAMASPQDAAIVAIRLLLQLSRTYVLQGRERSATISLGVSSFPSDGTSAEAVLDAARRAMAAARAAGGGYQRAGS